MPYFQQISIFKSRGKKKHWFWLLKFKKKKKNTSEFKNQNRNQIVVASSYHKPVNQKEQQRNREMRKQKDPIYISVWFIEKHMRNEKNKETHIAC